MISLNATIIAGLIVTGVVVAAATASIEHSGYVETVIDGDSLKINRKNANYPRGTGTHSIPIRLHGIDAVELHQTCDPQTWRCGHAAWQHLYNLIKNDRQVSCVEKDRDRYGRIIAICANKGGDLGQRMVAEGWALAYRKYSAAYVNEEDVARNKKLGIWRGTFMPPEKYRRGQ